MARYPDVQYIRCRTDGNAARKIEVVAPIKTMRLPSVKPLKPTIVRIDPLAVTAVIMVAIMAFLMIAGLLSLQTAQKETAAMQSHVEKLQVQNEELQVKFQQNCKLEEIERAAMALGMVPKNQVPHITVRLPQEVQEERQPGAWEQFTMFLAGLFA